MPRRPTRTVPTVLVAGQADPEPGHWLEWLADQLAANGREVLMARMPVDQLDPPSWVEAIRVSLDGLPADEFDVLAHSLGAVAWLHYVISPDQGPAPSRVALVAPPSAAGPSGTGPSAAFFPPPLDVDALRRAAGGTVLVAGDDDPYCPEGAAQAYGRPLMTPTTVISGGGHLDPTGGYGSWPAVLDWCGRDNLAFIG